MLCCVDDKSTSLKTGTNLAKKFHNNHDVYLHFKFQKYLLWLTPRPWLPTPPPMKIKVHGLMLSEGAFLPDDQDKQLEIAWKVSKT